jgi:hypothetical protein
MRRQIIRWAIVTIGMWALRRFLDRRRTLRAASR